MLDFFRFYIKITSSETYESKGGDSTMEEIVASLTGPVRITCLDRQCTDGQNSCQAMLSLGEDATFKLVTGIVPGADYLGSVTFTKEDILEADGDVLMINAHLRDGESTRMILEPRKE